MIVPEPDKKTTDGLNTRQRKIISFFDNPKSFYGGSEISKPEKVSKIQVQTYLLLTIKYSNQFNRIQILQNPFMMSITLIPMKQFNQNNL